MRSVLSLDEKIFDIAPSSQQPSTMLALKLQRQGYTARRMTDHEKSQLNRLVWGELTLAPINTQFFVLSTHVGLAHAWAQSLAVVILQRQKVVRCVLFYWTRGWKLVLCKGS